MTPIDPQDAISGIREDVAEIKTLLRLVVGTDGNGGKLEHLDTRVTNLEHDQWKRTGVTAAVGTILGGVMTFLFGHRS